MFKQMRFLLAVAILMIAAGVNAQVTTSAMAGKVTDSTKESIIGATIQVTHEPSGTRYGAITNVDGRFSIQGMRTGGPYKVEISYIGYQTVIVKDITLALGATYELEVEMKEATELLSEVVVTASKSKFSQVKTGASTNVSNADITNLPTVNRSISDLAKLSPYSNGMSFAGSDGRSTNFTVDGANFNNNSGLSSALPGGGTPISLDAIEEVQMIVAPYDVRQSNFVGGGINAITKSGTNTFKGTAYGYYTDQNLRGNKVNGVDLGDRAKESEKTYGFTLGGPIIKNKLFFFANFESTKEPNEVITYRPDAAKISDLQKVKNKLINDYGYDPGSWDSYPGGNSNMKILARIDWNITDKHKMSVRFNKTDNSVWYAPNGNSCDDNYRNKQYNRSSETSTAFSGNMYKQMNNVWSVAAELNSRFNDNISNQFIATYTNINDPRGSNSDLFPQIDIMSGDTSTGNYVPYITLGYELFSYNNGVKNNTLNIVDNFTYYTGNHKITAGLSYEYQTARNSYMRNGTGYYRFASLDDFLNGNTPLSFALTYGYNGDENPAGQVKYHQAGVYAQDDWNITKNFKLNFGIRADALMFDDSYLTTNNAIYRYSMGWRDQYLKDYEAGKITEKQWQELKDKHVLDTGKFPKTHPQFSPRVGFNWDIRGDKSLVLRGGTGLFMGRLPLVFFTNMPQYSGTIQGSIAKGNYSSKLVNGQPVWTTAQKSALDALVQDGKVVTDVNEMIKITGADTSYDPSSTSMGGNSYISAVDPDFHMPQIWKTSIAADYKIPVEFPLTVSGEFMFNKTIYGTIVSNWNINTAALSDSNFTGADNRIDYSNAGTYTYGSTQAYVLTNTKKGWGYNANITVKAEPVKNLNVMLSYTRTESKEISGMPGSAAESTYTGLYTVSGNEFEGLQRSAYVVPDKIMVNIGYFIPWKVFHGEGLHVNAIYTAYSPQGYSYTYSNDMNGDGIAADLMYIPENKFGIAFADEDPVTGESADREAFWAFVNNDPYLSSHKGQYAGAYGARAPWVHNLDLRIAEDFTFKIGKTKHTFELSASFDNFLNMINSSLGVYKWSCYQTSSSTTNIAPLKYVGKKSDGTPYYSFNKTTVDGKSVYPTEAFTKYNSTSDACWRIMFGLKYKFN